MKLGCDEAGRGPVLGSMFVTTVRADDSDIPDSVDDSKNLTNNKILDIYETIKDSNIEYVTTEVEPEKIDSADNLTNLSTRAYIETINELNFDDATIYIDCYSNNKDSLRSQYKKEVKNCERIKLEYSADEKYEIVSLASIISKAKREIHIQNISENYNYEIGSGYPSDPNTQDFLEKYVKEKNCLPDCVRKSWSTSKNIEDKFL